MANLFSNPNYLFTWKDVKTYLIRSQYNELLTFVTNEFFKNQYKTVSLPPFLDTSCTLSLTNFDETCTCGGNVVLNPKTATSKEKIAVAEKNVRDAEKVKETTQVEFKKAWKVLEFERIDKGVALSTPLDELKTAIIGSTTDLVTKIAAAKVGLDIKISIPFNELEKRGTAFSKAQTDLVTAKTSLTTAKNEYNKEYNQAEFDVEQAQNKFNLALKAYDKTPNITTQTEKEDAEKDLLKKKKDFIVIQGKSSTDNNCDDVENTKICLPNFRYTRKISLPDSVLVGKNIQFDYTTNGLTVGAVLWLYYYERMGIFKILGVLMDDYNYKGKYTISGSRKDENGNVIHYSQLMDMICTLHRLGIGSNLRDRICTYQRTLGVSIENNLGIESERNSGFMQNFNTLLDYMLEYYKAKQLAQAINTGNQVRSSVATQTSILDTIRLMKQQFEPFQYGRNDINTFLGISIVNATLCLLNMLRTEIGIPAQYEKPEELIGAAYKKLVGESSSNTLNENNRFITYDSCACNGLILLNDIETMDINQLSSIGIGSTLDLWLDDVERRVEGYRNAYKSISEPASAIV